MTATQNIARLIPTAQAVGILGNVLPSKKKKKKKLGRTGVETIVGLAMLRETSHLANSF